MVAELMVTLKCTRWEKHHFHRI